ncbi:MAG: sodium/hydrogen antiporter [Candidatus Binatia bacterium]|nr:MAG: sodium/hydrogen antiporter [Candidatus Binatia bacterium]
MAFYQVALVVAVGMAGQVLSARLGMPSILLLLGLGTAVGPDVLGWVDPRVFGDARADLVSLAVTVILFEGGLALQIEQLRTQQRSLILLLTAGGAISMLVGAWAAHRFLGMDWRLAVLYGSLVIVTGPTVVTPLLARLTVERRVRELLISEGVLVDPVGAIAAIVTFEYVAGHYEIWQTGWFLLSRLVVGSLVGGGAGLVVAEMLRRKWIAESLVNPVVLGSVLLAAALASRISAEAGLMSAVVQGVVMGNRGLRDIGPLRQFKEELTVLLLSFLFVLLAADLPLAEVRKLGSGAFAVVACLLWVARPLSVFLCTIGSELSVRERLFVSWICPRGIVAASVAGLFRIFLQREGIEGGLQLEALVFATVASSVALQGFTAGPVARLLGVHLPSLQGTMIVGADYLGRLLARLLQSYERNVALIDRNPRLCHEARRAGLSVFNGDALSVDDLELAGARYVDVVVALTTNQELNTLVAQRVRDNFRVDRILALGEERGPDAPFPGNFPGVDEANRLIRVGRAVLAEYRVGPGEWVGKKLSELPYAKTEFVVLLRRKDRVFLPTGALVLEEEDRIHCLRSAEEESPLGRIFEVVRQSEVRKFLQAG